MRRQPILDQGFLFGAYHFGTGEDVDEQVDNFLDVVGDTKGVLLALDFEPNPRGTTMSLAQAVKWLQKVYEKTGQRPVIYSGHLIKEALNKTSTFNETLKEHRLWLAQYGNKAVVPDVWDNYWIWQYTGDGIGQKPHQVTGFQGDADLNVFDGTEEELRAQWTGNGDTTEQLTTEDDKSEDISSNTNVDSDLPWMKVARSLLGIKEIPGRKSTQEIIDWAEELGGEAAKIYDNDDIPWCSLYVAHVMQKVGQEVTNSPLWALSWRNWGDKLSEPSYGAIMVFKRTGGGHVGFYVSEDSDYYHILGGNQGNMVCIKAISKDNCVGMRWPPGNDLPKSGPIKKKLDGVIISEKDMV